MNRAPTPLGALDVSPRSRRVIEASIAAGTSGPAFWALHAFGICFIACLAIAAWLGTGWAFFATLSAPELGLEMLGIPFFGFFAILATIVWGAEIRFLRRALRPMGEAES